LEKLRNTKKRKRKRNTLRTCLVGVCRIVSGIISVQTLQGLCKLVMKWLFLLVHAVGTGHWAGLRSYNSWERAQWEQKLRCIIFLHWYKPTKKACSGPEGTQQRNLTSHKYCTGFFSHTPFSRTSFMIQVHHSCYKWNSKSCQTVSAGCLDHVNYGLPRNWRELPLEFEGPWINSIGHLLAAKKIS
jgi:hypothetical protein